MMMFLAVKFHSFPNMFENIDDYTRNLLVIRKKMIRKPTRETLDLLDLLGLPGESIDGVFHGVGRQAEAVVADGVNGVEIAFEGDVYGDVLKLVTAAVTRDLY